MKSTGRTDSTGEDRSSTGLLREYAQYLGIYYVGTLRLIREGLTEHVIADQCRPQ